MMRTIFLLLVCVGIHAQPRTDINIKWNGLGLHPALFLEKLKSYSGCELLVYHYMPIKHSPGVDAILSPQCVMTTEMDGKKNCRLFDIDADGKPSYGKFSNDGKCTKEIAQEYVIHFRSELKRMQGHYKKMKLGVLFDKFEVKEELLK